MASATGGSQGFAQLVCLLGDFTAELPTPAAMRSLTLLLAWLGGHSALDTSAGRHHHVRLPGLAALGGGAGGHHAHHRRPPRHELHRRAPATPLYPVVRNQLPAAVTQERQRLAAAAATGGEPYDRAVRVTPPVRVAPEPVVGACWRPEALSDPPVLGLGDARRPGRGGSRPGRGGGQRDRGAPRPRRGAGRQGPLPARQVLRRRPHHRRPPPARAARPRPVDAPRLAGRRRRLGALTVRAGRGVPAPARARAASPPSCRGWTSTPASSTWPGRPASRCTTATGCSAASRHGRARPSRRSRGWGRSKRPTRSAPTGCGRRCARLLGAGDARLPGRVARLPPVLPPHDRPGQPAPLGVVRARPPARLRVVVPAARRAGQRRLRGPPGPRPSHRRT